MDTVPPLRHTLASLCTLAALIAFASAVRAEPHELAASVVWRRDDLVYIATPDSAVLVPGMVLSIVRGKRERASATVTRLLEPRLALARVSGGTLANEKRLDRLRVRGERAPAVRWTTLRVGLPGRGRGNLLFPCTGASVSPRFASESYAVDSLEPGLCRLRRNVAGSAGPAPDTLLVRLYGESADEEIALERGDIDAAVFWPGELSARLRADARWRDAALGLRARGVVAALAAEADSSPPPPADLAAFDRDGFAGDLLPWSELEPPRFAPSAASPARWSVAPTLPGARVLERVLARAAAGTPTRTLRLTYLDVPLAGHDSVQGAWRTRGVTPVFAVRCPVLVAPAFRPLVALLGAEAFANLVTCAGVTP